jgi:hypothetical protein
LLQNSNDVFAVNDTKREDLLNIVSSGKSVKYVCIAEINSRDFTQDRGRCFLLSYEDAKNRFLEICEKLEGNILHPVVFKNGDLLWKMSRGGTVTLLDYIYADKIHADKRKGGGCEVNKDWIWDTVERTVLVVAEPGMGKSSTTTQVVCTKSTRSYIVGCAYQLE